MHVRCQVLFAILNDHNQVEEGPGGVYAVCERLAAEEAESLVTEMRNFPDITLVPHDDDPRVMLRLEQVEHILKFV